MSAEEEALNPRSMLMLPISANLVLILDPVYRKHLDKEAMEPYVQQFTRILDHHSDALSEEDYETVVNALGVLNREVDKLP